MFNVVFYAVVLTIILSQLGFDPLALFISVSGVILAFAFMIGSAASKYFEVRGSCCGIAVSWSLGLTVDFRVSSSSLVDDRTRLAMAFMSATWNRIRPRQAAHGGQSKT